MQTMILLVLNPGILLYLINFFYGSMIGLVDLRSAARAVLRRALKLLEDCAAVRTNEFIDMS
jgi:hypothetical protein